jgi:drug/metabolite transporter (DMT)-like permease
VFRNQPPGFRWLVGGFAALAGLAFVIRFFTDDDRPALLFGIVCLVAAGYWLIFDREPAGDTVPADDPVYVKDPVEGSPWDE